MKKYGYFMTTLAAVAVLAAAAPWPKEASAPLDPATASKILSHIAVGDDLTASGQFDMARAEYSAAAELLRAEGKLPVAAVRRIANSYYFQGSYGDAAQALARLADEAESYGDPITGAWAIADAAWIAELAGSGASLGQRLERALHSPELPGDVREEITTKVGADLIVLAPHLDTW